MARVSEMQLARVNRKKDADTAANMKKLQWKKGRHLNVFEVR